MGNETKGLNHFKRIAVGSPADLGLLNSTDLKSTACSQTFVEFQFFKGAWQTNASAPNIQAHNTAWKDVQSCWFRSTAGRIFGCLHISAYSFWKVLKRRDSLRCNDSKRNVTLVSSQGRRAGVSASSGHWTYCKSLAFKNLRICPNSWSQHHVTQQIWISYVGCS